MTFPLNIIVALIVSAIHVLLAFSLKLPRKYNKPFRHYSIGINFIFMAFLLGFSIFFNSSLPNQGITVYYNGLVVLYFLLFIPLGIVLMFLSKKLIMNADIYLISLKHALVIGIVVGVVGLIALGYVFFILTFYGFAP